MAQRLTRRVRCVHYNGAQRGKNKNREATMTKRSGIWMLCGCLLLAGALSGVYYAWQEGYIPASVLKPHPRAPLPENFLATLQGSRVATQTLRPSCLLLNLYTTREIDRMGRPGLSHMRMPGWDVIV